MLGMSFRGFIRENGVGVRIMFSSYARLDARLTLPGEYVHARNVESARAKGSEGGPARV